MKTSLTRLFLVCVAATVVAVPASFAQRQGGKAKGPVSKIYLAEVSGEVHIQNGERIYAARQSTAFDAPGSVIETKGNARSALVFSNGTGLLLDENSRVEVSRFEQERFQPVGDRRLDGSHEPSASQSNVVVRYGTLSFCTSQMISGSSMLYSTPLATINIRGGKVVIESKPDETIVDLLDGDVTVRAGNLDVGGQILRPGERAVIRAGSGSSEQPVAVQPIPHDALLIAEQRVEVACNAKKTVTLEDIERRAEEGLDRAADDQLVADGTASGEQSDEVAGAAADTQEIVASPTVPGNPPNNIVISPDRLPGT